jgi:hypothetical protein
MKYIDEIEKVYGNFFQDSFDKLGLMKYEERDGPGTGASMKFKNDFFRLQILNDRGLLEMGILPLHGSERFVGIEILNSLILLETNESLSVSERKKILGTRLSYVQQGKFLLDNSDRLKTLLDKNSYRDTLKRIDVL